MSTIYGKLELVNDETIDRQNGYATRRRKLWRITAQPHVMIRLKNFFPRVDKFKYDNVSIENTQEVCRDIEWFMARFPLEADAEILSILRKGAEAHRALQEELELVMAPDFKSRAFRMAKPLRDYQARTVEVYLRTKALLVADQVGLGKTVTAIGGLTEPVNLPALVVCQTHLVRQWQRFLAEFLPDALTHIIKKGTPYALPKADVYLITYHKMAGWAETLAGFIQSMIFDEAQELRHAGTGKYKAAQKIRGGCFSVMGLSATPIYNYGGEMFNVMEIISPGKLGSRDEFNREWCYSRGDKQVVKDPKAFGAYLRDNFLMLRRTRKEVGRELPPLEKSVQMIPYSPAALDEIKDVATELARLVLQGHFHESGEAARELDWRLRQATGIAKAPFVAEFVKMLVDDGQQVVLFGWHREVYDVWMERFRQTRIPAVLYTGTETPKQKDDAQMWFQRGWTKVLIMSLRAGSGVDGMQVGCNTAVFGELDWSPGVHEQCIGRLNRDGTSGVSAFFLLADGGSDPVVAETLGLKTAQVRGMVDPKSPDVVDQQSDMGRVKKLAAEYLKRKDVKTPESASEESLPVGLELETIS